MLENTTLSYPYPNISQLPDGEYDWENELRAAIFGRLPSFDDMGYDPDETPRRIVIPTEPGESIEVPANNFLTDCTGIMPYDVV